MSISRWSVACWFVMGIVSASPAFADDPLAKPKTAAAREHLTQGNKLYRLREFEKAIEEYKAGALRDDANVFLYNLGQCYRQLGKYDDAIWHYERFLSRAQPTGNLKTAVENFVQQMKDERDKKAMTQPPVEPAPEPVNTTTTPPTPPIAITATTRSEERPAPWYADGAGWALTGTGLIGAGIGGYLLLDSADLFDRANNEDRQDVRQDLRDKAGTRRVVGAVLGAAGVGLLATGVIKLVLHPSPTERPAMTSWGVGITDRGVQVFGIF